MTAPYHELVNILSQRGRKEEYDYQEDWTNGPGWLVANLALALVWISSLLFGIQAPVYVALSLSSHLQPLLAVEPPRTNTDTDTKLLCTGPRPRAALSYPLPLTATVSAFARESVTQTVKLKIPTLPPHPTPVGTSQQLG